MTKSAVLPLLLKELRLPTMLRHYRNLSETAIQQATSHEDYLAKLCELEINTRKTNRILKNTKQSKLPVGKSLSSFNFKHPEKLNKPHIEALAQNSEWVANAENVLIFGASGVGKTHLAAAIGHALIEQNIRVLFLATSNLVQQLQLARKEYRLPQMLTRLSKYPVLILDDIGYAKKDETETSVLFDLIAERYETGSMIVTSNQPFSEWDQIFPSNMMAVAAIDRIIHHATIIKVNAQSYRKKHAKAQIIKEDGIKSE
jgi:DNA replication protein DnaC